MGTTVQKVEQKCYTDSSGKFYEGMRKEDISEKRMFLIFDAEEEFDRIDTDLDGVLSHDEITAEINKDIKDNDDALIMNGVGGISLAALGLGLYKITGKVGKFALAVAVIDGLLALRNVLQANKLEKRVAQGYN